MRNSVFSAARLRSRVNIARILAGCVIAYPAMALDIVDKQLQVYGTLHTSIDFLDSGISEEEAAASTTDKLSSGDVSVSFNSSFIGFRGEIGTDFQNLTALYQIEQNLTPDGGSGDSWSTRNTFVGLRWQAAEKDRLELLAGRYDSQFKLVALEYSLLKHTVADRGAILGAGASSGNKMDQRVENMLMGRWYTPMAGGNLRLSLQYSPDAVKSADIVDNNQHIYAGAGVDWSRNAFTVSAGMDHWQSWTVGSKTGDADNLRLMARYKTPDLTLVGLAENIRYQPDDHSSTDLDRKAWGLQAAVPTGRLVWTVSVLKAADYRGSEDTGALMTAVGVEKALSRSVRVYGVATRTANDDHARFQGVDGTHGDELGSLAGGTPKAISAGLAASF